MTTLQLFKRIISDKFKISSDIFSYFGENFMKIQTKIAKLQMHENLHKNVNENMLWA